MADRPCTLVAFLSTDTPDMPEGPTDRELRTLKDVLAYMDEDAELWRKSFSRESAADRRWRDRSGRLEAAPAGRAILKTPPSAPCKVFRRRRGGDNERPGRASGKVERFDGYGSRRRHERNH